MTSMLLLQKEAWKSLGFFWVTFEALHAQLSDLPQGLMDWIPYLTELQLVLMECVEDQSF